MTWKMAVRDMKKWSLIMGILCGNLEAGYKGSGAGCRIEEKAAFVWGFLVVTGNIAVGVQEEGSCYKMKSYIDLESGCNV